MHDAAVKRRGQPYCTRTINIVNTVVEPYEYFAFIFSMGKKTTRRLKVVVDLCVALMERKLVRCPPLVPAQLAASTARAGPG